MQESFLCPTFCASCFALAGRWRSYLLSYKLAASDVDVWSMAVQEKFVERFLDLEGQYAIPPHVMLRLMRLRPLLEANHEKIGHLKFRLGTVARFESEYWRHPPVDQLAMLLAISPEVFQGLVLRYSRASEREYGQLKLLLRWVAASPDCPDPCFLYGIGEEYASILRDNPACQLDILANPEKWQRHCQKERA